MKKVLLLLLLVTILAVSCTPETKFVCPDGSTVDNPILCKTTNPEQVVSKSTSKNEETAQEVLAIPQDIQDVLNQRNLVKSLSYDFKEVNKPLELPVKIYVKDGKVKREMEVFTDVLNKNKFDVVIFENSEATGYCESEKYCIEVGEFGELDYDRYYIETPFDWVDKIDSAEKVGEQRLFNRDTLKLSINDGQYTIWVDTYYGTPLRVEFGQRRYEFRKPLFNRLSDEDVSFTEKE